MDEGSWDCLARVVGDGGDMFEMADETGGGGITPLPEGRDDDVRCVGPGELARDEGRELIRRGVDEPETEPATFVDPGSVVNCLSVFDNAVLLRERDGPEPRRSGTCADMSNSSEFTASCL